MEELKMFDLKQFDQHITGQVNFKVLDIVEDIIPKKDNDGHYEVIKVSLDIQDIENLNRTQLTTTIFKSTSQNSIFYDFAVGVNEIYAHGEVLSTLIGATGTAYLTYYQDKYPNLRNWKFFYSEDKTSTALDFYENENNNFRFDNYNSSMDSNFNEEG